MQTLCQVTKAYHNENLVYYLGRFAAKKLNFTWFVTVILGLDASTFQWVKGACSVIPFKGACGVIGYKGLYTPLIIPSFIKVVNPRLK